MNDVGPASALTKSCLPNTGNEITMGKERMKGRIPEFPDVVNAVLCHASLPTLILQTFSLVAPLQIIQIIQLWLRNPPLDAGGVVCALMLKELATTDAEN